MNIYIWKGEQQYGPYTEAQLREFLATGNFSPSDQARVGNGRWQALSDLVPAASVYSSGNPPPPVAGTSGFSLNNPPPPTVSTEGFSLSNPPAPPAGVAPAPAPWIPPAPPQKTSPVTAIVGAVVLVLVIAGIGGYMFFKRPSSAVVTAAVEATPASQSSSAADAGPMADAAASGSAPSVSSSSASSLPPAPAPQPSSGDNSGPMSDAAASGSSGAPPASPSPDQGAPAASASEGSADAFDPNSILNDCVVNEGFASVFSNDRFESRYAGSTVAFTGTVARINDAEGLVVFHGGGTYPKNWDVQLRHGDFSFSEGHRYHVIFNLKSVKTVPFGGFSFRGNVVSRS